MQHNNKIEQIRTQEDVRNTWDERKLAVLLECADDAIVEQTLHQTVVSWNHGAERIFGYTAHEAMGRSIEFIVPDEYIAQFQNLFEHAMKGERLSPQETVCKTHDGKNIDVSLIVRSFTEPSGKATGLLLIVRDITEQKRTIARQSSLVRALIAAQEEERRRVAYDLHDGLTQYVMASHAHLETYRYARESNNPDKAHHELEQGLRYLKEAVAESRHLVNGLRSLALDNMGLAGALDQMLKEEKVRAGWAEGYFVHNTGIHRFDKVISTAIFRVAQEALTNARKHANASRVRMMLLASKDEAVPEYRLTLEVRDWGDGFLLEQQTNQREHFGMQSMQERTRLLEGHFHIQSAPGEGTVIRVSFPITDPPPGIA